MANILVIDDDELVRETLDIVLQDAGHTVILAQNGRLGLKQLDDQAVDLVITDLFMPEMEGFETMNLVRRHQPDLKVIAISGGGRGSDQGLYLEEAEMLGADASLAKPFKNSELIALVERLLS
jgi:CheY-like chemotaxis protein